MKIKTYKITKTNFLNWYFNSGCDQEQEETRAILGGKVIEMLLNEGKAKLSVKELFEDSNHETIPCEFLEGFDENFNDGEYIQIGDFNVGDFKIKLVD